MTTIPRTIHQELARSDSPTVRASALTNLADIHEMAGMPGKARLLALVADTEKLLADSSAEPARADDAAWEHDGWWVLASTRDRAQRADLLQILHDGWAGQECGTDAEILLHIAETERSARSLSAVPLAGDDSRVPQPPSPDVNNGRYPPWAGAETPRPTEMDTPELAAPPPDVRESRIGVAKALGGAALFIVPVAAVVLVAAPTTPLTLRLLCALALAIAVCGWFGWMWRGLGR